ncbi:MAG: adenylate kinase [Candidatus Anoxymicrobium japonicum]|uniref:Adenylate kinase n=1 Tax=Candidatus Anoxymicrobium japonicum TaxID=2013648 RepID=A0A2N3G6A0_9ACTN|nr:MAG: adenylate kinase [Candidatus Anoxymicrobium japonicum]
MNVVLLGPPGAGKGTQSERMAAKYGLIQVSTGDIFRANLAEGTRLGLEAGKYMDSGELVPDVVVESIVTDRLENDDVTGGFILDGFPRSLHQAEALNRYLQEKGKAIDLVVNIDVDPEVLVARLTGRRMCRDCQAIYHVAFNPPAAAGVCDVCGSELFTREDDREATVRNRLEVYSKQTEPLIEYYTPLGKLVDIDGSLRSDEVFEQIILAMDTAGGEKK